MRPGPLSLVVPVYNEEGRAEQAIEPLIAFVDAYGPGSELIFVDDGSADTTVALIEKTLGARSHPSSTVRVLRRAHAGKGAATHAGILDADAPIVAFCDVDLATPLDELARVVEVAAGGVLAVGSRGLPTSRLGARESRARELLGNAFNRACQLVVTPGIADTQCGAKAAPRAMWQAILPLVQEPGYAWDVEVIAHALAAGLPVAEVPIVWNHRPDSALHVSRDGARMVASLPAIRRRVRARRQSAATTAKSTSESPNQSPNESHGVSTPTGAFDDSNAQALAASDTEHWWFRSKAAYVNWALGRFTEGSGWLADIGAGSGGVSARLAWDRRRLVAIEGNDALAARAHGALRLAVVCGDAAAPPLAPRSLDVVCLLDVIEHAPDPVALLRAASGALAPNGVCIVTVPGHQQLWSQADEVLGHERRYNRAMLRSELEAAGLRVELVTHVFGWLVPPVWLRRRVTRADSPELGLDVDSEWISRAALVLTACERSLLRRVSLPLGTSVLAVARKAPHRVGGG